MYRLAKFDVPYMVSKVLFPMKLFHCKKKFNLQYKVCTPNFLHCQNSHTPKNISPNMQ